MKKFPEFLWTCRRHDDRSEHLVLAACEGEYKVVALDEVLKLPSKMLSHSLATLDRHWEGTAERDPAGKSSFRDWMEAYDNSSHWHQVLRLMLESELKRNRERAGAYKGDVFKDRDEKTYDDCTKEEHFVASLFHSCRLPSRGNLRGGLRVGDELFWLLGFQWPNQGGDSEKGRRADLVGLSRQGGLAVFECKLATNPEPPLKAVIQGLDYLSHLLRRRNVQKICEGFDKWRSKPGQAVPAGFEHCRPKRNETPHLIVLAPEVYYGTHRTLGGNEVCDYLAVDTLTSDLCFHFAVTDFQNPNASLLGQPTDRSDNSSSPDNSIVHESPTSTLPTAILPTPPAGVANKPIYSRGGGTDARFMNESKPIPDGKEYPRTVEWQGKVFYYIK